MGCPVDINYLAFNASDAIRELRLIARDLVLPLIYFAPIFSIPVYSLQAYIYDKHE